MVKVPQTEKDLDPLHSSQDGEMLRQRWSAAWAPPSVRVKQQMSVSGVDRCW